SAEGEDLPLAVHVPDAYGPVAAGRGQVPVAFVVVAEGQAHHRGRMSVKLDQFFPGGCVPDRDGLVVPGRGQALRVRGERRAPDRAGNPPWLQGEDFLLGAHFPDPHRPLGTRYCQVLAIRTERDAAGRIEISSFERAGLGPGAPVPDAHLLVATGGGEVL